SNVTGHFTRRCANVHKSAPHAPKWSGKYEESTSLWCDFFLFGDDDRRARSGRDHLSSPVKLSIVFMARHARRVAWPDAQAPSLAIPPRAPVQRMNDGPFANEAAGLRPSTRRLRRSFFLASRPFWLCQCVSG